MHSKIFTLAGLSSLAATAMAQDHDYWVRSLSSDTSAPSSLQYRDVGDAVEQSLSSRDVLEIGTELLARAFGSSEEDSASYASLISRAIPSRFSNLDRAISRIPNYEVAYGGYRPMTNRPSIPPPMIRREVDLDELDYAFYIREAAKATAPKVSASKASASRSAGSSNKAAKSSSKKSVSNKIGSGLDKVGQVANGVANVGNKAGSAATGVANAASGVANAASGIAKAGSSISSLVDGAADLFSSIFKREALALALAHAEAEAEADPELDSWTDEGYGSHGY